MTCTEFYPVIFGPCLNPGSQPVPVSLFSSVEWNANPACPFLLTSVRGYVSVATCTCIVTITVCTLLIIPSRPVGSNMTKIQSCNKSQVLKRSPSSLYVKSSACTCGYCYRVVLPRTPGPVRLTVSHRYRYRGIFTTGVVSSPVSICRYRYGGV